jgi:hypothetical protein
MLSQPIIHPVAQIRASCVEVHFAGLRIRGIDPVIQRLILDWGSLGFFENQDVLQWQCLQRLQVCKPDSFHLSFDLLHGHLVHQFNGHIGILLAVFDKDDATAGLQGLADFGHDFKGVG